MISAFLVLHVFSVMCLLGVCCAAAASPLPDSKRRTMIFSGIASFIIFLSGFGLAGILKYGFPGWVIVKILCWLALSAIVGVFFRKPEAASTILKVCLGIVVLALLMVYLKPF